MLASPWSAASLYFSDCSQKHIFPWCYFRTLARAGKDMVSLGGYHKSAYSAKKVSNVLCGLMIVFSVDVCSFELLPANRREE